MRSDVRDVPGASSRTVRLPIFENGIKPSTTTQQRVALEGIRLVCRRPRVNIESPGWTRTERQLDGILMTLQSSGMHAPSTRPASPRITMEHMRNNDKYWGNKGFNCTWRRRDEPMKGGRTAKVRGKSECCAPGAFHRVGDRLQASVVRSLMRVDQVPGEQIVEDDQRPTPYFVLLLPPICSIPSCDAAARLVAVRRLIRHFLVSPSTDQAIPTTSGHARNEIYRFPGHSNENIPAWRTNERGGCSANSLLGSLAVALRTNDVNARKSFAFSLTTNSGQIPPSQHRKPNP